MYYGIITAVEQDIESIRILWELRLSSDNSTVSGFSFTFNCPPAGTRAEIREEIASQSFAKIRPVVESANAAAAHLATIRAQIVGRRWPSL